MLRSGLEPLEEDSPWEGAPSTALDPALRRFGDYELLEEVARGGMGVVYRARQISLNRIVAVKMILSGPFTSAINVERFRAEAEAAANLQHPNIVAIHEVGEHEGLHYYSMDFVAGRDLAALALEGPLPPKRASRYLQIIAEAIHHAHQEGILHRDLKPSNVLIDAGDQPRITDFGLAKRFVAQGSLPAGSDGVPATRLESRQGRQEASPPGTPALHDLTVTGQVLGSPNYIPPEQASGKRGEVGRWTDVYSLGAVLYHLLTGRAPFQAGTATETLHEVLTREPVSPRRLNPSVPRDLETICLKCLEKEPRRRYPTAQALADELGRFLRDEPIFACPVSPPERLWRWCRRKPALAILALALHLVAAVGLGGIVWQWRRAAEGHLLARQNLYAADMQVIQRAADEGDLGRARNLLGAHVPSGGQEDLRGFEWHYINERLRRNTGTVIGHQPGGSRYVSLSNDGRLVAAGRTLWSTDSGRPVRELATNQTALAFAPSGQRLLVRERDSLERDSLILLDMASGGETVLVSDFPVAAVAFSPRGHWLALGSGRGLQLWDATAWRAVATNSSLTNDWFTAKGLAFSPDERRLITGTGYPVRGENKLACWNVPSLEPVAMPENAVTDTWSITFSPDGSQFITGGALGTVRVWDATSLRELVELRLPLHHRSWIGEMHFLPGTSRLVSVGADRCIRIVDWPERTNVRTLRGHTDEIFAMAVDPRGTTVVTTSRDGTLRKWSPLTTDEDVLMGHQPIALAQDGQTVVTLHAGSLRFWDLKTGSPQEVAERRWANDAFKNLPADPLRGNGMVAVSSDLRRVVLARPGARLMMGDVEAQTLDPVSAVSEPGVYVEFSSGGRWLAERRSPNVVAIWDVAARQQIASLATPGAGLYDGRVPLAFAAQAALLAIAGPERVLLWDANTRRSVRQIVTAHFVTLALSRDGHRLATGSADNKIRLYDCHDGQQLGDPIEGHLAAVDSLAFSPDGRTLVSGGAEGRVKFWNLPTRREVWSHVHEGYVAFARFSDHGNTLVTADPGRTLRLWRTEVSGSISAEQ